MCPSRLRVDHAFKSPGYSCKYLVYTLTQVLQACSKRTKYYMTLYTFEIKLECFTHQLDEKDHIISL